MNSVTLARLELLKTPKFAFETIGKLHLPIMALEIADNIWCEFNRVNHLAGFNPQTLATRALSGLVDELSRQVALKSVAGDAWSPDTWRLNPATYFATFDIAGTPKAEIPQEVATPLINHCETLGFDPSKLASQHLALVSNGLAKKYLGKQHAAFTI